MAARTENKYVTFMLGETKFGIPVFKSKEIVEYNNITVVPDTPDYIDGVINLRGGVVTIVDLMKRFFGKKIVATDFTSVIISEPVIDGEINLMGLVVDAVKDVLEIKEEFLEPAPKYGSKLKAEYIKNVASLEDGFVIILDIDRIMSSVDDIGEIVE